MKKISIFAFLLTTLFLSGCLKDTPNNDFSTVGTIVEIPYSGLENFNADALNLPSDPYTYTFVVNVASPYPPTSAIDVTIGIDDDKRTAYNALGGLQYEAMPSDAYSLTETNATIAAGSRQATFTIDFYKSKLDPSKNFMLPISITDASGQTISGNFGTLYYHAIGNPIAGSYLWDYHRWPNATGSGNPDSYWTDEPTVIAPVTPTQAEVASGYYTATSRYEITFDNNGGVLSNFGVTLNADDVTNILNANGITVTQDPVVVKADPANKEYIFQYVVFSSGAGANRWIVDRYHQ